MEGAGLLLFAVGHVPSLSSARDLLVVEAVKRRLHRRNGVPGARESGVYGNLTQHLADLLFGGALAACGADVDAELELVVQTGKHRHRA